MNAVAKAVNVARYLGPGFVWRRVRIQAGKRLGRERRIYRPRPWETIQLSEIAVAGTPTEVREYAEFKRRQGVRFLFPFGGPRSCEHPLAGASRSEKPAETVWTKMVAGNARTPGLSERVQLLRENRCVYFQHTPAPKAIDWFENPFDGRRAIAGEIWCDIPDFDPRQGDIRTLWEPARAAWAIDLARAHVLGVADDAREIAWRWMDSWAHACPPFSGVHWKCGQEAAVRFIAIALAHRTLADESMDPQRWMDLARLAWATGYRIAHHIDYAISQKNNHATSEACGLILVSHVFPEFREAARWAEVGRRTLAQELRRQIYEDGSYVQHSFNYERVMLHGALMGMRLAELTGEPFERDVYERVGRCADFLDACMDERTGRLPNYGNNDGALVLPLSECDFTDFRPVVQSAHFLARRERRYAAGPWDEESMWLFGDEFVRAALPTSGPLRSSRAFESGGYYVLRGGESHAVIRCHTYRDRPAHMDPLHVDLWWRGLNILQDAGTHQYYMPDQPELERYFKSIAAHNAVQIDDAEPVEWVSRFLCFPWPTAEKVEFGGELPRFLGDHTTYRRGRSGVLHRRMVSAFPGDAWLILDEVFGEGAHRSTLRWHMGDFPHEDEMANGARVALTTAHGRFNVHVRTVSKATGSAMRLISNRDESPWPVVSPYYGEMRAGPVLECALDGPLPHRYFTLLFAGEGPFEVREIVDEPLRVQFVLRGGELRLRYQLDYAHGELRAILSKE